MCDLPLHLFCPLTTSVHQPLAFFVEVLFGDGARGWTGTARKFRPSPRVAAPAGLGTTTLSILGYDHFRQFDLVRMYDRRRVLAALLLQLLPAVHFAAASMEPKTPRPPDLALRIFLIGGNKSCTDQNGD